MEQLLRSGLKLLTLLGRCLLALLFVLAGFNKLGTIAATSHTMASHGIPLSDYLVWGVAALELGGGMMLIVGFVARIVALVFFFYLLALAVMFYPFWTATGQAQRAEYFSFYTHLSVMGGMLFVVAFGPGPYSIDALIWRRPKL